MQNGQFSSKIALRLNKVCYKVSLCENCQRQSCRAFIGLTIHAKIIGGDVPFYLKFCVKVTALEAGAKSPIFDLFSFVAPQPYDLAKKSSIDTNRKSTTSFPMSSRWTSYVVSKPLKGGSKKQCRKFEQWAAITPKRHEIGCQSLIGSRIRAFDWYPPRWPWMTLSGVTALLLRFLTEFDCFAGQLRHSGWRQTYNVRKIFSPIYSLPLLAISNPPCSAVSLR